jgi:hypothetical protein
MPQAVTLRDEGLVRKVEGETGAKCAFTCQREFSVYTRGTRRRMMAVEPGLRGAPSQLTCTLHILIFALWPKIPFLGYTRRSARCYFSLDATISAFPSNIWSDPNTCAAMNTGQLT